MKAGLVHGDEPVRSADRCDLVHDLAMPRMRAIPAPSRPQDRSIYAGKSPLAEMNDGWRNLLHASPTGTMLRTVVPPLPARQETIAHEDSLATTFFFPHRQAAGRHGSFDRRHCNPMRRPSRAWGCRLRTNRGMPVARADPHDRRPGLNGRAAPDPDYASRLPRAGWRIHGSRTRNRTDGGSAGVDCERRRCQDGELPAAATGSPARPEGALHDCTTHDPYHAIRLPDARGRCALASHCAKTPINSGATRRLQAAYMNQFRQRKQQCDRHHHDAEPQE
jgi:hypothetical protein